MLSAMRLRILSCGMISGFSVVASVAGTTGAASVTASCISAWLTRRASTSCSVILPSLPLPAISLTSNPCCCTRCLTAGLRLPCADRLSPVGVSVSVVSASVSGFGSGAEATPASVVSVHKTSSGLTSSSCRILIAVMRPASGAAISTTTLSVSISTTGSCAATVSPSATSQRVTVASVPSC